MSVAVTIGAYNEEKYLARLLDALHRQTRPPEEIVIVDDGSTDGTAEIAADYAARHAHIRLIRQKNAGPAAARNRAWRAAKSDICIFTDGDCVPEPDWIERLLPPFSDASVAAVAGTYRTLNPGKVLAAFIGLEISWRYRHVRGEVNCHGTYNLAVRRRVLAEVGGLNEAYKYPSGEDWDMTYRISKRYRIIFVPEAVVGHYHPENFWWYMKNQVRRGMDRIRVYKDHPQMRAGDAYTGRIEKYQVLSAGLSLPSLILLYPFFQWSFLAPAALFLFLLATAMMPFAWLLRRSAATAFLSIPVRLARDYAWLVGLVKGVIGYGL